MGSILSQEAKEDFFPIQLDKNRIAKDGTYLYGEFDSRQPNKPDGFTKDFMYPLHLLIFF